MTKRTALARARRGAKFLDKKLPGWRKQIRVTRLDLSKGLYDPARRGSCGCILAQIDATRTHTGNYTGGAKKIGIEPWGDDAVRLGFRDGDDYATLTEAWREILREESAA